MSASPASKHLRTITAVSSIVAGLAWLGREIGGRISPDPDYWDCNSSYDYALNATDTVAFIALALTLFGLYRLFQAAIGGRWALIGVVAAAGFVLGGAANLLEHCAGLAALGFAYVIGLTLGMFLLLAFELTLTRAQIPNWSTGVLLVGTVAGVLLANQGGLIAFGCSWVLFGIALLRIPRFREI